MQSTATLITSKINTVQALCKGSLGLKPPLELVILQKLYYKASIIGLDFYKNKGSLCRRICLLCHQTSLDNMNMMSQKAHPKHKWWPFATERNPHMKIFCVRHWYCLFLVWFLWKNKIEQILFEESVVYRKVWLAKYVNLQMLKHCFVS